MPGEIWPRDEQMFWGPPDSNPFALAGGPITIPQDYFRTTLIVTGDGANAIVLRLITSAGDNAVITLSPQNAFVILTYAQVGPLVFQTFRVSGPIAATGAWTGMGRNRDPRDYGYPDAYMSRGSLPERAAPSLRRKRLVPLLRQPHRSGLYSMFDRHNPNLFGG